MACDVEELKLALNYLVNVVDSGEKRNLISIQDWNEDTVTRALNVLAALVTDPVAVKFIGQIFPEILFPLVCSAIPVKCFKDDFRAHQRNCVALSQLINGDINILRYSYQYFQLNGPPWPVDKAKKKEKKARTVDNVEISRNDVLRTCLRFLRSDPLFFKDVWNWSEFLDSFIDSSYQNDQYLVLKISGILFHMSEAQMNHLGKDFPVEIVIQNEVNLNEGMQIPRFRPNLQESPLFHNWMMSKKLSITNVEGVFLYIYDQTNAELWKTRSDKQLVKVKSMKQNLRNLALGIGSGKPICLSGPVGSGKTSLVEYIAAITGRISNKNTVQRVDNGVESTKENKKENVKSSKKRKHKAQSEPEFSIAESSSENGFLRIQLGHETDSKTLLGQYCCTDMPGEFVWQPGVLTQAVLNGQWLLLEDLDSATQDVCTVLTNLLENGYLSVPGFRDFIKIEPGFQLFFTIRTQNAGNASNTFFQLLEKHLYMVNIVPLSREELGEIISKQFPKLATVAPKIVNVFLSFTSGCHDEEEDVSDNPSKQVDSSRSTGGRLISTRDLLKLCKRSNPNFSVTSTECAYFVFQNAVDVFCSHLSDGQAKTDLVKLIGGKLGIIQSRCEFLAKEFKPSVELSQNTIKCGRGELKRFKSLVSDKKRKSNDLDETNKKQRLEDEMVVIINDPIASKAPSFSFTRLASCLVERVMICVQQNEPVLLVGETGVGKTSSIQYLAHQTRHKLMVVNMNNQSDVADLVGGFKPVDLKFVVNPIRLEFDDLFRSTFNSVKNEAFLNKIVVCYRSGNFNVLIKSILTICTHFFDKLSGETEKFSPEIVSKWNQLDTKCKKLDIQLNKSINISFSFIPGSLVNCLKNGDWILLDEINLASTETLECLSTILEPDGSIVLLERGDLTPIPRHPDFRIFACMNPNTDIGKKDLPTGIRNRFTEYFVDELTTEGDLTVLIGDYLANSGIQKSKVVSLVKMYKKLKSMSELELTDGLGNRPIYSLRTLCRALSICAKNYCGSIERNLYESFCLSFLTQVDQKSHSIVLNLIQKSLVQNLKAVTSYQIPKPVTGEHLNFEGYWIETGSKEELECKDYILTDSVRMNLKDLARIISIGKLPILLQGPTSAGKTSLIEYIAKRSGNFFLRINNHEHTDLQEYIGTYTTDVQGKLVFKEGVLVQAMRNGYWIILDELNLAPSDILEALNRVLDDNRELFIPETQTTIKAHPNFMLFATQNPPGLYGGRKTLSRAFKNRFIELHFNEIPQNELEIILEKRCQIPQSYALKMVKTMAELQMNRSSATKQTFTLRDLFRWGNRYTFADKSLLSMKTYDWNQHLVDEGYLVLSAKVRNVNEIQIIEETLFKTFRKKVNLEDLFSLKETTSWVTKTLLESLMKDSNKEIVWTTDMRRMAIQAGKAIQFNEPVLLVGPTGCGKTTICQILSQIYDKQLRILNCHLHTEAADFLGGLRPYRSDNLKDETVKKQLFEWADGPLVYAMREGSFFLSDEISLAEDSVLERLNCVLEPERTVLLVEKVENNYTDDSSFIVKASDGFQFFATMNPGGDFGKKELSPALRNRFTEIWCRPTDSIEDLSRIAENALKCDSLDINQRKVIAEIVVKTIFYLKSKIERFTYSVRDILSWVEYISSNCQKCTLSAPEALMFGMETILLDFLEMIPHQMASEVNQIQTDTRQFLVREITRELDGNFTWDKILARKGDKVEFLEVDNKFGICPFYVEANQVAKSSEFMFAAPTTKRNLFQLLSALTVHKAILLEGPPGVGKTSLVENLAKTLGFEIVRINLCEHTDLADLFGTDLPCEQKDVEEGGSEVGSFMWRDGPLMAALKSKNTWILLDELNLAPQNVLEGLNAILDHRGEVYIPELNKSFKLKQQTKIFSSQNPLHQGGGRKGLPQSFLNRFTKVYMKKLNRDDLLYVVKGKYGKFFNELIEKFVDKLLVQSLAERMVEFSDYLDQGIGKFEFGHKGGPFEMNLRDILQWCDFLSNSTTGFICDPSKRPEVNYDNFLLVLFEKMRLVYSRRMRTCADVEYIRNGFRKCFEIDVERLEAIANDLSIYWTDDAVYINDIKIMRNTDSGSLNQMTRKSPLILSSQMGTLRDLSESVLMAKPILLCGGSDSGKTKLIDSICTLLRNSFDVDTIDDSVTGSFQQVDLNRHLDGVSQTVEKEVFKQVQEGLVSDFNNPRTTLLKSWENCQRISDKQTFTKGMNKEVNIFLNRLQALESIIKDLKKRPNTLSEDIEKSLSFLKIMIKRNSNTLNSGGQFEWVDSKIVKCLKQGTFINLEHVNLCSSAVLDRLNSVFEPEGTLLIAEKALTKDDKLEVIEKDKNFRAFLTLDPKNGEISRAMRNRCLEMWLDKNQMTIDDMKKLVFNAGIQEMWLINTVVDIHLKLSSVSEHSTFSVSDLMKLSFLLSENQRLGLEVKDALEKSAIEVYIRSAQADLLGFGLSFYRNKLVTELGEVLSELGSQSTSLTCYSNLVLSTDNLDKLARVKLQCEPLRLVLSGISRELSSERICFELYDLDTRFEEIDKKLVDNKFIKCLLFMIFEMASRDDLHLREIYLNKSHVTEIAKMLNNVLGKFDVDPKLPWNRKIFPRIRDYSIQDSKMTDLDQIKLSLHLFYISIIGHLPEIRPEKRFNPKEVDFLTYSMSVAKKQVVDDLDNELVKNLSGILSQCDEYFERNLSAFEEENESSLKLFVTTIQSTFWRDRLWNSSRTRMYKNQKKEVNESNLNSLLLHFQWFRKKFNFRGNRRDPDGFILRFESIIDNIRHEVDNQQHPLYNVQKYVSKQLTNFAPFYDQLQVENLQFLREFEEKFVIKSRLVELTRDDVNLRVNITGNEDVLKLQSIYYRLTDPLSELKMNETRTTEIVSSDFKPLVELYEKVLKTSDTNSSPDLIPLFEYFSTNIIASNLFNDSLTGIKPEFFVDAKFTELSVLNLIKTVQDAKWAELAASWNTIKHLPLEEILNEPDLKRDYKNFMSVFRGLFKVQKKFTTNNVLTKPNLLRHLADETAFNESKKVSISNYGPLFTFAAGNLLFGAQGELKSVGLGQLEDRKSVLSTAKQLVWNNVDLVNAQRNLLANDLRSSVELAERFLKEINHVQSQIIDQSKANSTAIAEFSNYFKILNAKLCATLDDTHDEIAATASDEHRKRNASTLLALVGAIELNTLCYFPFLDPVEKSRQKMEFLNQDINNLRQLALAYKSMGIISNYELLGGEVVDELRNQISQLETKKASYSKKVPLRPTECLYQAMKKDFAHFLITCCHPKSFCSLLDKFDELSRFKISNTESNKPDTVRFLSDACELIKRIELWINNAEKFECHILKPYQLYYRDFVEPTEYSIIILKYALNGIVGYVNEVKDSIIELNNGFFACLKDPQLNLIGLVETMVEFPSLPVQRHNNYSLFDHIPNGDVSVFKLLKSQIFDLLNQTTIETRLDKALFGNLDRIINSFNIIWKRQDELKRKRQAEENSLYVTKISIDEEEDEEAAVKEHFPNFLMEDFGDFVHSDLNQIIEKTPTKTTKHPDLITDEDHKFICLNFMRIFDEFFSCYYHLPANQERFLDFITPFKIRVNVFHRVLETFKTSIDYRVDDLFYLGAGVLIDHIQESMDGSPVSGDYDFYKDSNVNEVVACTEFFKTLRKRVEVELQIWPDHAVLNDLITIVDRIKSLSITSPIVRFNTGFQLLQRKIAEWNSVAHRNNNLIDMEVKCAEFIQRWTKLEMQYWRECLNHCTSKTEARSYKYFFFFYNLIHEFLSTDSSAKKFNFKDLKSMEKVFDGADELEASDETTTARDVIILLNQFMESSTYGEFKIRLKLIKSFELYIHGLVMENETRQMDLISIFHHIHLYFDQFSAEIADHIKTVRGPIEKKLKEFVKIESYNRDLTYIGLRNNIVKVQKTIHKFFKEFESQLVKKVATNLDLKVKENSNLDISFTSDDKGMDLRFDSKVKYYIVEGKLFVSTMTMKKRDSLNNLDESWSIFYPKIEKYFSISRNIVKELINSCEIPLRIQEMDSLLSEEIEGYTYLRGLEVDRSQERPKQKSQAKQILNQKRKALADGFKMLTSLGLNYRSGLLEYQLNDNITDFKIRPFDIKSMIYDPKYKKTDNFLVYLSDKINVYYAKTIHKIKVLFDVLNRPHTDIGMNMERMKGFAIDLFLVTQNQRNALSKTTHNLQALRTIIKNLGALNNLNEDQNTNESFKDLHMKTKSMIKSSGIVHSFFEQFKIVLRSVPANLDPKFSALEHKSLDLSGESELRAEVLKEIGCIMSLAKTIHHNLFAIAKDQQFIDPSVINSNGESFNRLLTKISIIKDKLSNEQENVLSQQVSKLLMELSSTIPNEIVDKNHNQPEDNKSTSNIEKIVHSMLISMQKLFKKHLPENRPQTLEELAIGERFQKGYFKEKIYLELLSDVEVLDLKRLCENLQQMLSLVESPKNKESITNITSILPLIDQFGYLVEFYLIQQLGSHKISLKIMSVMLTVFIELGKNGFCVPQDLLGDEEDKQKDDKGDKTGDGFGLEDGTGENDVSDRVESEDQLEDAKKPDEYNKEKEDSSCKEEKGIDMSEDFDSNLQDVEKKPDDENDSDHDDKEEEEDPDKEMGETEDGAEKLDDQIWGDDENKSEDEENGDEQNEEEGKGNSEEQEGHNDLGDNTEGSEKPNEDGLDAADNQPESEKKKKEKDIDHMKEPEVDEDQVNPHHNELEEPEEPEAMDLDNVNLDGEEKNDVDDEQGDGENPFDIDQMKDSIQENGEDLDDNEENKDEEKNQEDGGDSSDDENEDDSEEKTDNKETTEEQVPEENEENNPDTEKEKSNEENKDKEEDNETNPPNQDEEFTNAKDKTSKQDNIQSVPDEQQSGTKDQVETEAAQDEKNPGSTVDQDTGEDKDGVGQAENQESDTGHRGASDFKNSDLKNEETEKDTKDISRKKGDTNENRTLAEHNKNEDLKTTENLNEHQDMEEQKDDKEASEFEHVKEAKSSDRTTIDNATDEQSKKVEHKEMEVDNKEEETNKDLMDTEETQEENQTDSSKINSEKTEENSKSRRKPIEENQLTQNPEEVSDEKPSIDGDQILTMDVSRGHDTSAHCQLDLIRDHSTAEESVSDLTRMKRKVESQINQKEFIRPESDDFETWQRISSKMMTSARDLCEQLRLILEPTKCTRLKGDYRSGRRINMKKIIPYLASQFRKDKIWLRRTKAAKRDYKITIAIDDSKSMHHNQSKELTLEAISLVAQALTLLESGKLSVVSFGETSKIVTGQSEQFDGPKLMRCLNFDQNQSRIGDLLNFVRVYGDEDGSSSDSSIFENLLLILSDGRNIFSEGEQLVKNAIKLAKLKRIFVVYIIIDNPDNKHSILDIKVPLFSDDRKQIIMKSYLDTFPFPYYVIVRDLGQLPSVLSDAMRQWFELVNSEQQ